MGECVDTARIPESVLNTVYHGLEQNCQWLKEAAINAADKLPEFLPMFNWRDVLPADVYNSTLIPCTEARDHLWTVDGFYGPARLKIVVEKCKRSFCTMVTGSSGNPDISGVGMVTTYYFELAFVTLCYLAHASSYLYNLFKHGSLHYSQTEKPVNNSPRGTFLLASALRIHEATIKKIMDTFLDAATFFALSITIASLAYTGMRITTYERDMLLSVSSLNLGGLYVVLSFSHRQLRRRRLRASLVSLVPLLNLIYYSVSHTSYASWYRLCKDMGTELSGLSAIPTIICGMIEVVGVMTFLCNWLYVKRTKCRRNWSSLELDLGNNPSVDVGIFAILDGARTIALTWRQRKRVKQTLPALPIQKDVWQERSTWVVATFGLALTWVSTATISWSRRRSREVAGDDYVENTFGYGQILALLIWLPVLLEYVYFAYYGSREGWEGRLPQAVHVTEDTLRLTRRSTWIL